MKEHEGITFWGDDECLSKQMLTWVNFTVYKLCANKPDFSKCSKTSLGCLCGRGQPAWCHVPWALSMEGPGLDSSLWALDLLNKNSNWHPRPRAQRSSQEPREPALLSREQE